MKSLTIAIKDLTRSFRSTFALVFMFGVPLMVTGMFYFMFGSMANNDSGFELPRTQVVLVNLDAGHPQAGQLGSLLADTLQSADFASLMEVSTAADAAAARQSVDAQQAGVAIIIPQDFSASFTDSQAVTEIEVYTDPTLTLGPSIVQSVLSQFTDSFAGVKITVALALQQAEAGKIEYAQIEQMVADYMAASQASIDPGSLIEQRSPSAAPQPSLLLTMIGPIMGGMMIFYAYFTGVNTANNILQEDEEGTLPRLFTTPTSQAEVLGGKFLAVGLTVLVQVVILLIAARLLFGIQWGALPSVALVTLIIVCSAAASGILVCSLLKNAKQAGVVFGALLTVTGMVGMMDIFTGNANSTQFGIVPLLSPQGWAARSMLLSMNGAPIAEILPYALVLLAVSAAFFVAGVWRFQKRYI